MSKSCGSIFLLLSDGCFTCAINPIPIASQLEYGRISLIAINCDAQPGPLWFQFVQEIGDGSTVAKFQEVKPGSLTTRERFVASL
jgi:hypothetical protein